MPPSPIGNAQKNPSQERDRWFESGSLQRRVCLASAFHAYRRQDPAFARSVSLDVTRERDVLATSRLALAAFLDDEKSRAVLPRAWARISWLRRVISSAARRVKVSNSR